MFHVKRCCGQVVNKIVINLCTTPVSTIALTNLSSRCPQWRDGLYEAVVKMGVVERLFVAFCRIWTFLRTR